MERFKIGARFQPVAAVHATRECDALVHRHGVNDTLAAAFASHGGCRFIPATATHPLPWSDAVARLESVLCTPTIRVEEFLNAYVAQLETCTAVAAHDYLAAPLLLVVAAWVSQQNLTERLNELVQIALKSRNAPLHIVLVAQRSSRQDDAASDPAATAAREVPSVAGVHLLRLGDENGAHTVTAVAEALLAALHDELRLRTAILSETANRLGRARRSTFSSWFRGVPITAPVPPAGTPTSPEPKTSRSGRTDDATTPRKHRRRKSFGGDLDDTPLFDAESFEAVARHLADMHMLAGRYDEASKGYHTLVSDFHSLTGSARIHEAAAQEMYALASTLSGGGKREAARNLETSALVYVACGRPELAVRAALRVAQFCDQFRIADKGVTVLAHVATAICTAASPATNTLFLPTTPSSFIDAAAGVLHARSAIAFTKAKKRRRAALNSFLSAARFSKLGIHSAAATVARIAHPPALEWPGVQDEYDLILGQAEVTDGSALRAALHFTRILANASDEADVELQSFIVRQLSAAIAKGAVKSMERIWDAGALFPSIDIERVRVDTVDSKDSHSPSWRSAENIILEDYDYFQRVRKAAAADKPMPIRERSLESVIAELRKMRDTNSRRNPGGSLENKIRMMRANDGVVRKRRRARSLIERCAVLGETIEITVTMKNPLHFPVFIDNMTPIVTLDGKCCAASLSTHTAKDDNNVDENEDQVNGHVTVREQVNSGESVNVTQSEHYKTSALNPVEFFAKNEIVLFPNSAQDVVLSIVAHKQGILRFIGAQWLFTIGVGDSRSRASSQIPGFAKLERRGRRLNDTRQQRASQTPLYEMDTTLEVEVTAPAPKIRARLRLVDGTDVSQSDDPILVFAGEMRKAVLTLTNEGVIEATDITFRIDTPETIFLDTSEESERDSNTEAIRDKLAHFIDENGNFVTRGAAVVAGIASLRIEPGSTITRSVWLRASSTSSSMQAAYARNRPRRSPSTVTIGEGRAAPSTTSECPFGITIAYGEPRVRISRCEGQLRVQPSIFVSRRFMSRAEPAIVPESYEDNAFGFILGVEAEHSAHPPEAPKDPLIYQIRSISVTSTKRWQLASLPTAIKSIAKDASDVSNKQTTLRINETATLFSVLYTNDDDDLIDSNLKDWNTSTIDLERDLFEPISPSGANADVPLNRQYAELLEPTYPAASQHFVLTNKTRTSLGAREDSLSVISVGWCNSEGAVGTLYLQPVDLQRWRSAAAGIRPGSALQTRSSSFASLSGTGTPERMAGESFDILDRIATESPPLTISLLHKRRISHDFQDGKSPAVVGVEVHIRNISQRLIDVVFAAAPHGGIADGNRGRYWTGDVAMTLRAIPPDAERYLQLSAVFLAPGSYDMAQLSVKYQISLLKQSQRKTIFPMKPSNIVVEESRNDEELVADALRDATIGDVSDFETVAMDSTTEKDDESDHTGEVTSALSPSKAADQSDTPTSVVGQDRFLGDITGALDNNNLL